MGGLHESAWLDCFFVNPVTGQKPAKRLLDRLHDQVAAEIIAVVLAVCEAPPPAFSGGGKWEAMHGKMAGFYEVRVRQGRWLYRLLCLLDRNGPAGPTLVTLTGGP